MLLTQDIGDIIGSEGAGLSGFIDGAGHSFWAVLPDQFEQLGDLTGKRTVGIGQVAKISLQHGS